MNTFNHELSATVEIVASGEKGIVIGRAEYLTSGPQYLLRYAAADGRASLPATAARDAAKRGGPIGVRMTRRTLTDAERAVGALLMRGMTNKQIARERGVTVDTVKAQVSSIMGLLGAENRTQAAVMLSKGDA